MTDTPITQAQLDALEKAADRVFAKLGIDIEFTRHFIDRVNDERNRKQITIRELGNLLAKEYQRWGKTIGNMPVSAEAVMKDLSSAINIPFVMKKDGNEKDLVAKTVMRKKDFKTPDKTLPVESVEKDLNENPWNQAGQKKPTGGTLPAPKRGQVPAHNRMWQEGDKVIPHTGPLAGKPHIVVSSRRTSVNIVPRKGSYPDPYGMSVRAKHSWLTPVESVEEESGAMLQPELRRGKRVSVKATFGKTFKGKIKKRRGNVVYIKLFDEYKRLLKLYKVDLANLEAANVAEITPRIPGNPVSEDGDPCWDNYKQVGMKKKNGKDVPNCVPESETHGAKRGTQVKGSDATPSKRKPTTGGSSPHPMRGKLVGEMDEPPLDVKTPTPSAIAKKHGVDVDMIIQQLRKGVKVELEHTPDKMTAMEIALDHLNELPDYYSKLADMEGGLHEMLTKGAWEVQQLREDFRTKPGSDPREAILKKALYYLEKMHKAKGDEQDIGGYAFDIARSFNLKDIVTPRELAKLYREWKGISDDRYAV